MSLTAPRLCYPLVLAVGLMALEACLLPHPPVPLSVTASGHEQRHGVVLQVENAGPPGQISGRVIDEGGRAVPGASLLLHDAAPEVVTDSEGSFAFTQLSPGRYTLFLHHGPVEHEQLLVLGDEEGVRVELHLRSAVALPPVIE